MSLSLRKEHDHHDHVGLRLRQHSCHTFPMPNSRMTIQRKELTRRRAKDGGGITHSTKRLKPVQEQSAERILDYSFTSLLVLLFCLSSDLGDFRLIEKLVEDVHVCFALLKEKLR